MENMRINVRQAHSDTYNGNPYIAFAGIMTGLLSVILFVDELDAVSFTVVGVLLFSGIYAYILSYAHYNKRKFLPFVIVGEVAVTAILSVFNIQRISEQSVSIMQALVDGRANTQNVTYVVFVSSVVLIYIIYLLEVIFKNRVILTLVTVVMLAASPILRLEVSLFHIFVIVMHQVIVGVSYAVLGRRKKMLYTTRSGKLIHKKSIIYCIAATVIIFFAADIITNIFSEYMYGSISGIEQTIYKTSKRISGKGSDVKINGEISSGNNYQSGITQMTVTVSKMPTEDLYLYGFRGGEYKGGSWDSTDDDTICKNIDRTEFKKETISQPVYASTYFKKMYYYINIYMRNSGIVATSNNNKINRKLDVKYVNDNYKQTIEPYYNSGSKNFSKGDDGKKTYNIEYIEQADMQSEWREKSNEKYNTTVRDYKNVQQLYKAAMTPIYSAVSKSLVPRLTSYVQANSLTSTVDSLNATINAQTQLIAQLNQTIQELKEQLNKNSKNSSKPPSSDGFKKPAPKSLRKPSGKKAGGQNGHQALELPICILYGDTRRGDSPSNVKAAVQYGENLQSLAVALNTVGAVSIKRSHEILSGVFNIPIATGTISSMVKRCADSLSETVGKIKDKMIDSALGHFDETGTRVDKKLW